MKRECYGRDRFDEGGAQMAQIIWKTHPGTNDYNTGSNWNPHRVPSSADTAVFGKSAQRNISTNATLDVAEWRFIPNASHYTFTIGPTGSIIVNFHRAGVVVNGGSVHIIVDQNHDEILFHNRSSAGMARIDALGNGYITFDD
jgi:hypothetical protein